MVCYPPESSQDMDTFDQGQQKWHLANIQLIHKGLKCAKKAKL